MGLPYGLYWGFSIVGWLRVVNSRASRTLGTVGARGVVHMPQFNGKQEGAVVIHGAPGLRCARNGQRTNHPIPSPIHTPLCALANQAHGKALGGCSASPDTGQHGGCARPGAFVRRVFGKPYHPNAGGEAGAGRLLSVTIAMNIRSLPACLRPCALAVLAVGAGQMLHAQGLPDTPGLAPGLAAPALQDTVGSATRTEQPLSDLVADLSIIERETIERSGLTGVADLLARLPGVEMARNGGLGSAGSVFLRAADSRHTAVFIDGVRVDSQTTGGAQWELIPLAQIDRIEVLRGPAAAVYGSEAIGGVIQLFPRKGHGPAKPYVGLGLGNLGSRMFDTGISGSAGQDGAFGYTLGLARDSSAGFAAKPRVAHPPARAGPPATPCGVGASIPGTMSMPRCWPTAWMRAMTSTAPPPPWTTAAWAACARPACPGRRNGPGLTARACRSAMRSAVTRARQPPIWPRPGCAATSGKTITAGARTASAPRWSAVKTRCKTAPSTAAARRMRWR